MGAFRCNSKGIEASLGQRGDVGLFVRLKEQLGSRFAYIVH